MEKLTRSAKRMMARAELIKDPVLRAKKIKDSRRLSYRSNSPKE